MLARASGLPGLHAVGHVLVICTFTLQGYEHEVPSAHVKLNTPMMPQSNGTTVFDWFFDKASAEWRPWAAAVPAASIPADAKFGDIFVPTVDSVRYTFLLDVVVQHHHPFLFVGPTGTGKTIFAQRYLHHALPSAEWAPAFLTLSARTTAGTTQEQVRACATSATEHNTSARAPCRVRAHHRPRECERRAVGGCSCSRCCHYHCMIGCIGLQIDGKLDRRRRGVFGPAPGKRAVVFVDDLNMPSPERYGAQPPLELLRQGVDGGGWFGRDNAFRTLLDVQLLAAMAPPGGGRAAVTPRLLRHFSSVALTPADGPALAAIFQTILDWHLGAARGYATPERALSGRIVAATLAVYQAATASLLPTPRKSHYVFNLRDYARVVSGFMLAPPSTFSGGAGTPADTAARLWLHEVMRVFGDRLTNTADQEWLLGTARSALFSHLSTDLDALLQHLNGGSPTTLAHIRRLFFTDVMDVDAEPNARQCAA
jgi:dynein heavy chain, axonemal